MKECSKCNQIKDFSEFYTQKKVKSGLRSQCKDCERPGNLLRVRRYRKRHPKRVSESNYKAGLKRDNTEKGRLRRSLKSSIYQALKRKKSKGGTRWELLLGYSIDELKKHLKTTLPDGYIWQDYFDGKLHIDHKIPISVFSFTKPTDIDFKRCWALENLQLLPKTENLKKYNKLNRHFQPSFSF